MGLGPLVARSAEAPAAPKLTTAVFQGSTVYSHSELFGVYGDQIGRPISRESAQAIVSGVNQLYQRDGFSPPEIRVVCFAWGLLDLRLGRHSREGGNPGLGEDSGE